MNRPAVYRAACSEGGWLAAALWLAFLLNPLLSSAAPAQERVIFGQVIDSVTGNPLSGAQAYFTTIRSDVHSASDGVFALRGDNRRDSVLVVRRIGYVPRSVVISPLTNLPVVDVGIVYLRPVATPLDEIA